MRTDTLSSDILEQQFGPTEVVVLYQDPTVRIICTRVIADGRILELSRAGFIKAGVGKFPEVHQSILDGLSMGKAFRVRDIEFVRETRAAYRQVLPAGFSRWFGSDGPATIVSVTILAGPARTPYAEILETYSPAVRWPHLAGKPTSEQDTIIHQLDKFLSAHPVV